MNAEPDITVVDSFSINARHVRAQSLVHAKQLADEFVAQGYLPFILVGKKILSSREMKALPGA